MTRFPHQTPLCPFLELSKGVHQFGGGSPAVLVQAIRRHWTIENGLHWVLDVTFREDDSRVRDRTAARNLALPRKVARNLVARNLVARNLVGRNRSLRASVRGKRKMAAWNDDYMFKLLTA